MIPILRIQTVVADYFGVSLADLRGRSRIESVAWPRHVAMYFAKIKTPGKSRKDIGNYFKRCGTAVYYAVKHVKDTTMDVDPVRRKQVEELEARFQRNGA